MDKFKFVIFFFLANVFTALADVEIFPKSPKGREGVGLVLKAESLNTPLELCIARFGGYTLLLADGVFNETLKVGYYGNGLKSGECGAKIPEFNSSIHQGAWVFLIGRLNGTSEMASTTIMTGNSDYTEEEQIPISASLGETVTIPCSFNAKGFDMHRYYNSDKRDHEYRYYKNGMFARYCTMSDPNGNVVKKDESTCSYEINSLKMINAGIWTCTLYTYTSDSGNQESDYFTTINIVDHSTSISIGHLETEKYFSIYCDKEIPKPQVNGRDSTLGNYEPFCHFKRPDKKDFSLHDGSLIDRYSYYGRGVNEGDCGISIEKPLLDEDKGTWACSMIYGNGSASGGFIATSNDVAGKPSITVERKNIYVYENSSLTMDCTVETTASYCWFKRPDGTRYHVSPATNSSSFSYHGYGLDLGNCGITIKKANLADSGIWTCGVGINTESGVAADIQETISVIVSDKPMVVNQTVTKAMTGDWAILGCRSLDGDALQYCSFIAPNGTGYNLIPSQESGRLKYQGAGLQYGDCGVLINPIIPSDYGTWQCAAMIRYQYNGQEFILNMELQSPSLMSSTTLGLLLGIIMAAVVVVVGFAYVKIKRRREASRIRRPVAFSGLSELSDDVVVDVASSVQGQS